MPDSNHTLARTFREIADLLALRGANPHRIRAYRRAADSVASLEEDIAGIAHRGDLLAIPGIGRELSAKIQEFLETGKIRSHEELKTPVPPELASWTTLPGMTEPVIHYLYHRLGIRNLPDLEALVRTHLLRTLPGLTVSEEVLLEAIQARQKESPAP